MLDFCGQTTCQASADCTLSQWMLATVRRNTLSATVLILECRTLRDPGHQPRPSERSFPSYTQFQDVIQGSRLCSWD